MYRSYELIQRKSMIQTHGVHIFSVYASLNVMLMNVFTLSVMQFLLCYV
jgi:hypothetical protein